MSFENNIKEWVTLDNKIKQLNENIKQLREQKNEYQYKIYTYIEDNNLEHATVQINDGKLRFNMLKQTAPLTLKFITDCLNEIIDSEEQVDKIIEHIKQRRNIKYIKDIKRLYNKD